MLVTVTNNLAVPINTPQTKNLTAYGGGIMEGGQLSYPLPHPFARNGAIAASGTLQRAVHPADFRRRNSNDALEPSAEWNELVNGGIVTLAVAAESTNTDQEEVFVAAV